MALPAPKLDPDAEIPRRPRESGEALLRPVGQADGGVVVEKLPLTLDVLLHPREDDQVTQSRPHHKKLNPLADTLERFLEKQPGVGVFSDLMILWEKMGGRDVAPDVYVVKGMTRDPDLVNRSFDPVAEGVSPCLVFEVVSTSNQAMVDKDELENPSLFEKMKVAERVLLYPPEPGTDERLRLAAFRLGRWGGYQPIRPDAKGWIRLRTVGLRIKVAEDGQRLLIEDAKTGERLLTSVEEEAARRAAEKRAEEEAKMRRQAEERAEREAEARHQAEQRLRRKVKDLCGLLGIEWTPERSTVVAGMNPAQIEALWTDLLSQKRWP